MAIKRVRTWSNGTKEQGRKAVGQTNCLSAEQNRTEIEIERRRPSGYKMKRSTVIEKEMDGSVWAKYMEEGPSNGCTAYLKNAPPYGDGLGPHEGTEA